MIEIEESSGNVYSDLEISNAEEMAVKAQLATKIGEIIKSRKWSQQQAADVLGISQPKLSKMLRGQFRGISEAKMLDCLAWLGRDVFSATIVADDCRTREGSPLTECRPDSWDGFFALDATTSVPSDFLSEEDRNQITHQAHHAER